MWDRFGSAIKAAFTLENFIAGVIWYGLPIAALAILGLLLDLPVLTVLSYFPLALLLLVVLLRARHEGLWPTGERGVRGWKSKVTEITPSPTINLWTLMFRLYGPDGAPANREVTCEVTYREQTYSHQPTFDAHHLQPGELPHYVAFYPFRDAVLEDGNYVLRWYERHGLSRRLLTRRHRFRIRDGRLMGAKHE